MAQITGEVKVTGPPEEAEKAVVKGWCERGELNPHGIAPTGS